jgi:hypothetical protein
LDCLLEAFNEPVEVDRLSGLRCRALNVIEGDRVSMWSPMSVEHTRPLREAALLYQSSRRFCMSEHWAASRLHLRQVADVFVQKTRLLDCINDDSGCCLTFDLFEIVPNPTNGRRPGPRRFDFVLRTELSLLARPPPCNRISGGGKTLRQNATGMSTNPVSMINFDLWIAA